MKCKNKSFVSKSQQAHMRHIFVLDVQHHKGSYVSIEEPTKGWVALNPKSSLDNHES
jgi:hypothetical protein